MFLIQENQNKQIPPCQSEVGEFFRAYDSELKGSRVFLLLATLAGDGTAWS